MPFRLVLSKGVHWVLHLKASVGLWSNEEIYGYIKSHNLLKEYMFYEHIKSHGSPRM